MASSDLNIELLGFIRQIRDTFTQPSTVPYVASLPDLDPAVSADINLANVVKSMYFYARNHDIRDDEINRFNSLVFPGIADIVYKANIPGITRALMERTFDSEERGSNDYKDLLFEKAILLGDSAAGRQIVSYLAAGVSNSDYGYGFIDKYDPCTIAWAEESIISGLCNYGRSLEGVVALQGASENNVMAHFAVFLASKKEVAEKALSAVVGHINSRRHTHDAAYFLPKSLFAAGLAGYIPYAQKEIAFEGILSKFIEGVFDIGQPAMAAGCIRAMSKAERGSILVMDAVICSKEYDLKAVAEIYAADGNDLFYYEVLKKKVFNEGLYDPQIVASLLSGGVLGKDQFHRTIGKKKLDPVDTGTMDRINSLLSADKKLDAHHYKDLCDHVNISFKCNAVYDALAGKVRGW
ncbi:MAG: hypothetical protein HGA85_02620 [Nanoarchaeota archaeon]|nr:hypothetical protein [Nanoarchaeota archaeon]